MYAENLNIKTEKKWLEVGDYVVGNVCFEAKSAQDFLQSVINKRLWNQLDNMDRAYEINIVIIYGNMEEAIRTVGARYGKDLPHESRTTILTNKFLGAIGRIALDTDAKPLYVPNESNAAKIITAIAKMQPVDRPAFEPALIKRISTGDLRVDLLTSIKGVSDKKAKDLLKTFGSIMEIGECKESEIAYLDGLGEVVAERILDVLHSEEKVVE
jgi:ERCC4-type nuclease